MGIYDRDYQQSSYDSGPAAYQPAGEWTLTTKLVLVVFGVYAVQLLTRPAAPGPSAGWFTDTFMLSADLPRQPWMAFQLLTYGFLHSPADIKHILFNMLGLWIFGRAVEQRYGQREFLTYFLMAIAFAGLCWVASEFVAHGRLVPVTMLGASGGVAAVLILFALTYPHQQVYIWGVLPMRAWVFALLFVGLDLWGAFGRSGPDGPAVAYTAHLGGALFAALYFKGRWRLERFLPSAESWRRLRPGPKLRVHHPDDIYSDADDDTDSQVDEILQKIQQHGQESLTRRERRILEEASREYQKRRR